MATMKTSRESIAERSVFWMILALGVGVFVVIALVMTLGQSDATVKTDQTSQSEVAQAPTGAGTNPDGVADEATEGMMNETATDDFVDSSAAADPETVENTGDGPDPATSADEVAPAEGDDSVVDRMTDEEASGDAGTTEGGAAADGEETDTQDTQSGTAPGSDDEASNQSSDQDPPLSETEGDVANQTAAMINAGEVPEGVTGSMEAGDTTAEAGQDVVVDPNNGYLGQDPDGGAAAFVPTPSGPEGRDDNAFTTD